MKLYHGLPRALKCAAPISGAADFSRRGHLIKYMFVYMAGALLFPEEDAP